MLPDIIAPNLSVLFCGINPGMQAAQLGHHFAGRNNRFWRVLHQAGFTDRELRPDEDTTLLQYRCGLTTLVERPTARADQLQRAEFLAAAATLQQKVITYGPIAIAFLGKAAYLALSAQRDAGWGLQPRKLWSASVWVLPNPSGRNRAFSLDALTSAYRELRQAMAGP